MAGVEKLANFMALLLLSLFLAEISGIDMIPYRKRAIVAVA
jgi:hypothetical protein